MDVTIPLVVGGALAVSTVVMVPATKYAIDLSPFLLTNTRISGRSSHLITKKVYEELLSSTSFQEVLGILEDTNYYAIVEHARDFNAISAKMESELNDTYLWLENVAPSAIKSVVSAIRYKFEINEIKKVVNCLYNKQEMPMLNHINNQELKLKLETAKDYNTFISCLEGTEYEEVFQGKDYSNLESINTNLDSLYFNKLMNEIFKGKDSSLNPFKDYFQALIDLVNVRLVIKKITGSTVKLLGGGLIEELEGITEFSQLESALANTQYAESIPDMKIDKIELGFFRYLKKLSGLIGAKYSLKAGSIVKYIILRELEFRNLNIILKLKSAGFKSEEIEKFLVI